MKHLLSQNQQEVARHNRWHQNFPWTLQYYLDWYNNVLQICQSTTWTRISTLIVHTNHFLIYTYIRVVQYAIMCCPWGGDDEGSYHVWNFADLLQVKVRYGQKRGSIVRGLIYAGMTCLCIITMTMILLDLVILTLPIYPTWDPPCVPAREPLSKYVFTISQSHPFLYWQGMTLRGLWRNMLTTHNNKKSMTSVVICRTSDGWRR